MRMKKLVTVSLLIVMLVIALGTGVQAATSATLADELYAKGQAYGMTASDKVKIERYLSENPVTDDEANAIIAKADEAEILLPPFLQLSITECEMTEQEKMIKDRNGNPPVGLFDIEITGFHVPSIMDTQDYDEKKAISFLNKLNTKKPALPEERQAYLSYKQEMMDSIIHDYEHQFLSKPVK